MVEGGDTNMNSEQQAIFREHARVFRTGAENAIKHELKQQQATVKEGKKATLQTMTKKGLQAYADALISVAEVVANNNTSPTTAQAKAIDRMTDDFENTANDLRRLSSGALKARSADEAKAHEEAQAKAQAALKAAQDALATLSRDGNRI